MSRKPAERFILMTTVEFAAPNGEVRDVPVRLEIDIEGILRELGPRAVTNKLRYAQGMNRLVLLLGGL